MRIAVKLQLAALLLVTPSLAHARLQALVVGINQYESQSLNPLTYAVPDAVAVRSFLVDRQGGGCLAADVVLLADDQPQGRPTKATLLEQLQQAAERLTADDTFLFYFAGHGFNLNGEDYLLPIDAELEPEAKLAQTAVPVSKVTDALLRAKARQVLFIVDACRDSNPTAGGIFGSALRIATVDGSDADHVRATLSAARPGQRAHESEQFGHGVFTYYLLQGLQGEAREDNGTVTADSLARYVQRAVTAWVTKNIRRSKDSQLPWLLKDGVASLELLKYRPRDLVDAEFNGTPLRDVLQSLAKQAKCDLLLTPGVPVDAPITLSLHQRPLSIALRYVVQAAGLSYEVQDKVIVVSAKAGLIKTVPAVGTAAVTSRVGRDGMPLILIPGGQYHRGSDNDGIKADLALPSDHGQPDESWFWNELSDREVTIASYFLDEHEVTNAQFRKFVAAGGYRRSDLWTDAGWEWVQRLGVTEPLTWADPARAADALPVAGVSYYEAEAYAKWAGRRLPTEAEWEYAAQSGRGSRYDFGQDFDPRKLVVGTTAPAAVKSHRASPLGLFDLCGNVAEWCADAYDPDFYRWGEVTNPICVASLRVDADFRRCVRGGAFDGDAVSVRARRRSAVAPAERRLNLGFRCASDVATAKTDTRPAP